ncbi:MAG TPA: hypothetical protein VGI26_07180 [Solirubrobacteraceae bacterium]
MCTVATVAAVGCGSSKTVVSNTNTTAAATSTPTATHTIPSPPTPATGKTVLGVQRVAALSNPFLVAGPRKLTVYAFESDQRSKSNSACTGSCASIWPPVTTVGRPVAKSPVEATKLATIKRADGIVQVTYNKHPLYYFSGDQASGETRGQGAQRLWYVLAPEGIEILR